jgi:hypothetical protein
MKFKWALPEEPSLSGLSVTASARLDRPQQALHWTLRVDSRSARWSIARVAFPELRLAELSPEARVFFPRGPGEVAAGVGHRTFQYRGQYPSSSCAMQFLAAYREGAEPTGLYVGAHDPWGSTKQFELTSDPVTRTVRLGVVIPATNPTSPGNGFHLSGEVVWQLLRGDWFDAATVYRTWARRQARWWPRLTADGRGDTTPWMRELNVWAMTGGAPADCVVQLKRFQESLQLPIGFHWYNWHQIPFDNDYPHYFPTKTGFAAGVAELQGAGVYVMPYINGRLWDSHDRGAEDYEFSRVALPAVTKQENGQPYLEGYGSNETNGQPVRLGVMCPATSLWQDTVRNLVERLFREEGTRAVYIDQVAAAPPKLCMDPRHGHALGGGHWWTESYWTMLRRIRREMPSGRMLTTECNAEPFIHCFDGYLTWHWQHDGQVPAFPAVYGGAIQMFGRAYRGGATKNLAFRMKVGQQLVYGEQIGWFDPALASEPENLAFLQKAASTRSLFRRYFHAGEMARPPRLAGPVPQVKADWQWSGEWFVTTDAVLTGAWRIPRENRVVLLFANVGDQTVTTTLQDTAATCGLAGHSWRSTALRDGQTLPAPSTASPFNQQLVFPPRSVLAWETQTAH